MKKEIYLRPITLDDTDDIVRWRNSDAVRTHFIYQKLFTRQSHEAWMRDMVATGKVVQMMICLKENDKAVGSVYIRDIDPGHQKGEYGIFIGEEDARGCGIGTEAARQMIRYAFDTLGLHRLFLRAFADNGQAIASYEKAGFKQEAYLREDVCIDGIYRDMVLMGIVNQATGQQEKQQDKEPERKAARLANMELLRVLAMMLVIVLHFLGKGGALTPLTEKTISAAGWTAWILESLAIVAVNVYMLISGYFLVESTFKGKRLAGLVLQVLFYSVGIYLIGAAAGLVSGEGFSVYDTFQIFLPVAKNHYWFMTAYIYMYLFSPLLAAGVKKLSKRQFQVVLGLLLFWFCFLKSVMPIRLETDGKGYDCLWYLCVFLAAAYIRLYGLKLCKGKLRCLLLYLACCAGVFGEAFVLRLIWLRTGRLSDMLQISCEYNHVLVFAGAVALFCLFLQLRVGEGWFSKAVCAVAPLTLGVYLLHEHRLIRYRWPEWLYRLTGEPVGVISLLFDTLAAVVIVFAVGIAVDAVRRWIFGLFAKGGNKH